MHSMIKEPETRDPLKEALDEVAKSDVNKRKILIPSEDDEDDPERKKLHLSTAGDDKNAEKSEVRSLGCSLDLLRRCFMLIHGRNSI